MPDVVDATGEPGADFWVQLFDVTGGVQTQLAYSNGGDFANGSNQECKIIAAGSSIPVKMLGSSTALLNVTSSAHAGGYIGWTLADGSERIASYSAG